MLHHNYLWYFILAMCIIIVLSNILVQYPLGPWLTYGALTFPFAFLVTDLATRLSGASVARYVIIAGTLVGIITSFVVSLFALTTLRITIASAVAFFVAQMVDMNIFKRLQKLTWWKTPIISTSIASIVDTFLFFGIAFSATTFLVSPDSNAWALESMSLLDVGPVVPLWISLAVADLSFKLLFATILLVPYRILTKYLVGTNYLS